MSHEFELSIVLPCLNEEETLGTCIRKARAFLDQELISGEIIVADNGSTDGSFQIATEMGARLIRVEKRGYGAALMGGILAAKGQYVIMGDADDSYDFADLAPFLEKLREGYELVIGNRFQGGIKPGAMPFLHQYLGNPLLSFIGRLFFHTTVGDFHCGLRGFRTTAIIPLDLRTTGMEFASEMVVKASLYGLKIVEVPTVLYADGRSRRPHLRTWRDGWRHLRFLLLYSPRWLFLYPGIALLLFGLLLGAWLVPQPRSIGEITFDINTLFYAALMVILGFQSIIFAVFTKVFAISEGLLAEDPQLSRIMKFINLESGLLIGLILALLGFGSSLAAVRIWESASFGNLNPSSFLRLVIPSGTMLAIGLQIILSSFFLSILGLSRK